MCVLLVYSWLWFVLKCVLSDSCLVCMLLCDIFSVFFSSGYRLISVKFIVSLLCVMLVMLSRLLIRCVFSLVLWCMILSCVIIYVGRFWCSFSRCMVVRMGVSGVCNLCESMVRKWFLVWLVVLVFFFVWCRVLVVMCFLVELWMILEKLISCFVLLWMVVIMFDV